MQAAAPYVIFATLLALLAAVLDARSGKIPNWLTLPALATAPLAHGMLTYVAYGSSRVALLEFSMSVAGALACAVVPVLLFLKGAIGGGDVKLFAAIGAICLPLTGFQMQLYSFVVAAVLAPLQMLYQRKLGRTLKQSGRLLSSAISSDAQAVPAESMTWFRLGPSIFVGSVIATWDVWW